MDSDRRHSGSFLSQFLTSSMSWVLSAFDVNIRAEVQLIGLHRIFHGRRCHHTFILFSKKTHFPTAPLLVVQIIGISPDETSSAPPVCRHVVYVSGERTRPALAATPRLGITRCDRVFPKLLSYPFMHKAVFTLNRLAFDISTDNISVYSPPAHMVVVSKGVLVLILLLGHGPFPAKPIGITGLE